MKVRVIDTDVATKQKIFAALTPLILISFRDSKT